MNHLTPEIQQQLEFLAVADKMKSVLRQTLLLDGTRRENNAEHSWHFALMAMTLFEHCGIAGVDLNRVIKMAIVHDLVEIYAGDSPAMDSKAQENQAEREQAAADKLFSLLPREQAAQYRALWEEFDAMQTPDAIYAAAVDRLQSFYNIYHNHGERPWIHFKATAARAKARMLPVEKALPALWPFVEHAIADSLAKGWLQPEE